MTAVAEEGDLAGFLLRHQGSFAASPERSRTHRIHSTTNLQEAGGEDLSMSGDIFDGQPTKLSDLFH